jgi:uncharacterized membrane protein YoaK (UPF0700 family)
MIKHLRDAGRTLAPPRGNPHGPLPPLLVGLTVVTGLVDAYSYLELRHVFVANMTGNVVFLAFSLGGAPGFLWWAATLAVAAFSAGALAGGRMAHRHGAHRGRHLRAAAAAQTALVVVAFALAALVGVPNGDADLAVLVMVLGLAMGLQNATARALAVPDLTTTVLTLTITGIAADSAPAGGTGSKLGRRFVPIVGMFAGALAGAALIETGHAPVALLIAAVLLGAVTVASHWASRSTAAWAGKP